MKAIATRLPAMRSRSKSDAAAVDQIRFTQAVEVEVADGIARTYGYPSNQELLDQAASRPTPPIYISRSILFSDGIPPEYAWAKPAPTRPGEVPKVVQRILWPQWIELMRAKDPPAPATPALSTLANPPNHGPAFQAAMPGRGALAWR